MRQRIRLTEGDLHRIVKESVQRILNEIGDSFEKPVEQGGLGLPKGAGKSYLANMAARKARGLGRNYQADNFDNYSVDNFNQNFGFQGPDDENLIMNRSGSLRYGNDRYPASNDAYPGRSQDAQHRADLLRGKVNSKANNMKAGYRNKLRNGLNAFDALNKAQSL
jgi:hypothetical protein